MREVGCCGGTEQDMRLTASVEQRTASLPSTPMHQLPPQPQYVPNDATPGDLHQLLQQQQQQQHSGLAAAVHLPVLGEAQLPAVRLAPQQQSPLFECQQQHDSRGASEAAAVPLPPPPSMASAMEGIESPPLPPPLPPPFAQVMYSRVSWTTCVQP